MTPVVVGIIGCIVLLLLLLFSELPIAFALGMVGFVGLWYLLSGTAAIAKMAITPFDMMSSYTLATLPLFLLMAEVAYAAGLTSDLYNLANKWVGRLPGGLAIASVLAAAAFSAISSSSIATAAVIGLIALPEMKKYRYHPRLATGSVCAGGTLGNLVPPGGLIIIYAMLTEQSMGKLFIACIVPGVLLTLVYMLIIYFLCLWKPDLGPQGPKSNFREKVKAFGSCGEILVLVVFVFGGILIGWFTSTEAAGVAALGTILFSLIRNRLRWGKFKEALANTMKTTGMIYAIIIGAFLFSYFLTASEIPRVTTGIVTGLKVHPKLIMAIIYLIYILLGSFMDTTAMIVLTITIFFPIVINLGFDPIWFGVVVVIVCELAEVSPPIGLNLFVVSSMAKDVPMTTIFKGVLPFIAAQIALLIFLLFFPEVALFLPNLMK